MQRSTLNAQRSTLKWGGKNATLNAQRSAFSVQRYPFSLFLFFLAASPLLAGDAPWRAYAVYQPSIERAVVVDAAAQPLRYNHDSSVAWFGDRWFCVWNANAIPMEGAPGQLNYVSVSRDGLAWSAPALNVPRTMLIGRRWNPLSVGL